jgi:predicted metal-dependent hydrolase
MILVLVLLILNAFIYHKTQEPRELLEIKEKYRILREHIHETNDEKFKVLVRPIPITGVHRMNGTVGYNVNKGAEITVCLDGKVNEIFHVLIHELAHSTVDEYSHSVEFWKNYSELRDMCIELGIYDKIPERTKFCGQHVQDK